MSKADNNLDVESGELRDISLITFINRKPASRRHVCFPSASFDYTSTNIALNTLIGRKRSRDSDNWARNLQKHNGTKGLAYINRGGKLIHEKSFVDIKCKCRQACNQKICSDKRETAIKAFYSLDSKVDQNIFLRGCIKAKEIKRRRPTNKTKKQRKYSFTYYFQKNRHDISVCKKYFRDTYQVSDGRIYKCCSKKQVTSLVDQRKNHVPSNKIDDTDVITQIKSFLAYTSHYTRAHNPRPQYLNLDLITSEREILLYNVFSTKFNLHFKQPSKDTRQTCDSLQIRIQSLDCEEAKVAKIEKEAHLKEAERARSQMTAD